MLLMSEETRVRWRQPPAVALGKVSGRERIGHVRESKKRLWFLSTRCG